MISWEVWTIIIVLGIAGVAFSSWFMVKNLMEDFEEEEKERGE